MAPRRGGSSRDGSSSFSSSIWTRKVHLSGSNWTESAEVAGVTFSALFCVTLIGIRIWAGQAKREYWSTEIWKAVMGKRWAVAIWSGMFFYCWQFTVRVLYEEQVLVANIFYIFRDIFLGLIGIAEIFLLWAIYTLLHYCFLHPSGPSDSKAKMKKNIYWLHTTVCCILGILHIVYVALRIKDVVEAVRLRYWVILDDGIPERVKVAVAYQAIFFVASVEVLAASIFLLVTKSKRGLSGKVVGFLLGLVAIPLFIRKIFQLAFTAHDGLGSGITSLAAAYAEDFIVGAAHVLCYAGVVDVVAAFANQGQYGQQSIPPQPYPAAAPMAQQPGAPSQAQQQYDPQLPYPQQQYGAPPLQQYGQGYKAFNAGSPPPQQGYYPPPQQNGYLPQQNGYPPQQFAPQPLQHHSPSPQQPGLAPQQQPTQEPSPISSVSPQHTAGAHSQQSSELPSTHY